MISEALKKFIFDFIDSVEHVEILLYLQLYPEKWFNPLNIANELRRNQMSVGKSLELLSNRGLLRKNSEMPTCYAFSPETEELKTLMCELSDEYKIRSHIILELIFSPMKKARPFADAFIFSKSKKPTGESDG